MKPLSTLQVANFFIKKSMDTGIEVTLMKLIKLTYLAHGWYLGIKGDILVNEVAQAWKYGPVMPVIYHSFKGYGNKAISELYIEADGLGGNVPQVQSNEEKIFLEEVWNVYKNWTGLQLSTLTHESGSPWYVTWYERGGKEANHVAIANDLIKDYYQKKAQPNTNK